MIKIIDKQEGKTTTLFETSDGSIFEIVIPKAKINVFNRSSEEDDFTLRKIGLIKKEFGLEIEALFSTLPEERPSIVVKIIQMAMTKKDIEEQLKYPIEIIKEDQRISISAFEFLETAINHQNRTAIVKMKITGSEGVYLIQRECNVLLGSFSAMTFSPDMTTLQNQSTLELKEEIEGSKIWLLRKMTLIEIEKELGYKILLKE